jgi:Flp pilus assembly protein TadD
MGTMLWGLAYAELMNGKNEDALSLLDQAIHESPNNVAVYRAQILALVRLGREEAARDAVQKILKLSPADRISALREGPFRDAAFAQEMAEASRLAGLPE